MHHARAPIVKDLVLIGGGHSHVAVLKRFGMKPVPGARVTIVSRDIHTPYSGMLPGLVAELYSYDDAHIDLGPLAQFARARLYHDDVTGLDLANQKVLCRSRPPIGYDVVSINVGSTPSLSVAGAASHAVPVKPISTFVDRWARLRDRVLAARGPVRIGVVGGGAAGVELTLAAERSLRRLQRDRGSSPGDLEFHLFSATPKVLPTHNAGARRRFERVLGERGVHVHAGDAVASVGADRLQTTGGTEWVLDEILWATEAGAQSWLRDSGLDVDERGFVRVADTLQSTSHPNVFAAGDVAAVVNHPREKAGVFAVRQGPPLAENLRRAVAGEPLEPFVPQKKFLSIITTGERYAVASRGAWSLEGRYIWTWKDWIDRRFMNTYNVLPEMTTEARASSGGDTSAGAITAVAAPTMHCGGCGAKIGSTVLARVLARLRPIARPDVIAGIAAADDAAIETVPAGRVVLRTVDAFRAIVDDPYLFGKITANHCLNDIFAMGGEPQSALAIATVPYALETTVEETLEQLLTGAIEVLNEANAVLAGGHSTRGAELSFGLAVSGLADPDRIWRKCGMQPGDRLVLTKPIGTGVLFAAHMRLKAKGRWIEAAIHAMLQSNRTAAESLRRHGASACTDVTGFGLLGHLVEMAKASSLDASLRLGDVPWLDGALQSAAAGIMSSLQPQNMRLRRAVANLDTASRQPTFPLMFDPQTAGGLLASVPEPAAERCVADLRANGYTAAAIVGRVEARRGPEAAITVEV